MRNILFSCFLLFQFQIVAFASCYTGFACNIEDLNQTLKIKNNIELINNYFDKKIIEPNFVTKLNNIISYNDLFLFNTIL